MMQSTNADRIVLNSAAQALLRILIGSYFVAVSLHIIPGTDLGLLFVSVVPAPWSGALAAGLVFVLAFMIMIALYTRVAALILGLMTFFASYLAMVSLGVADELAAFWRDLALIAALVLTYSDKDPRDRGRLAPIRRHVIPRRIAARGGVLARLSHALDAAIGAPAPTQTATRTARFNRPVSNDTPEVDNIFLD
jgi:uncharacterized membrane protein YphA (DoxX/SURF4 family)